MHAIKILNCLAESDVIDVSKLKRLVFLGGVPDEINGLRPIVWRIMLN